MAHVVAIQKEKASILATPDDQMGMVGAADGIRQEEGTARTQIGIPCEKTRLIPRSKIIHHRQVCALQFQKAVTEVRGSRRSVKGAITRDTVNGPVRIRSQSGPAHPDSTVSA